MSVLKPVQSLRHAASRLRHLCFGSLPYLKLRAQILALALTLDQQAEELEDPFLEAPSEEACEGMRDSLERVLKEI